MSTPLRSDPKDKAALAYRMIATAMRDKRGPTTDVEVLALLENHVVRQPDPLRAKDDIILGLTYIMSGLLIAGAAERGLTRDEAAQEVLVLAGIIESGQAPR